MAALATAVGSLPGVISGRFESVTRSVNVAGRKSDLGKVLFFNQSIKDRNTLSGATGGRGF